MIRMICKMNIYKLHFTTRDRTRDKVHCTLALEELSQCREKALGSQQGKGPGRGLLWAI